MPVNLGLYKICSTTSIKATKWGYFLSREREREREREKKIEREIAR